MSSTLTRPSVLISTRHAAAYVKRSAAETADRPYPKIGLLMLSGSPGSDIPDCTRTSTVPVPFGTIAPAGSATPSAITAAAARTAAERRRGKVFP